MSRRAFITLLIIASAIAQTPMERAKKLVANMTTEEKLAMVHGYSGPYVGNVAAIPRLKIPALHLEDGPQGIADGVQLQTCWPSALTVVATWDEALMEEWGKALGREQRIKGTNIMLGPMINIARVPMDGRNFESFGEDPYLSSRMVGPSVRGIQSQGVMACAKHFADNNQETNRTLVSENVGERTQWEIYYPAFQAAIDAGVGSIMCSYNRVNGTYACENEQTLNRDLKGKMGFQGFVMSDWGATHSTVKAANSGLDMQMPDDWAFGEALAKAVKAGQVTQERLTDMALRILYPMFQVGLFDTPQTGNLSINAQSLAHTMLARKLATHATILAKNADDILPLGPSVKTIAVLGDDGQLHPMYAGSGSGHVDSTYVITPFEGIQKRAGADVKVKYAPTHPITTAAAVAKAADIAIVFTSTFSSEGMDRPNLSLDNDQDELIAAVAAANPNTIVVSHGPGSVLMPWIDQVKGVLLALYPGQEDGNAIASVLFGDHNPSGKLPVTFAKTQKEIPVNTPTQWPGIENESNYTEKLLVGYRWYDEHRVAPLFPFGHGLSYTTFNYTDLSVTGNAQDGVKVSVTITNSGKVAGHEVAQMYLTYPTVAGEPPMNLRGFKKVDLNVGESTVVRFDALREHAFSIFDDTRRDWRFISGTYGISVGSSSRDIRARVAQKV